MRLATWNVNSIRARIDRVIAGLESYDIDALAMQEIKCTPEQFPFDAFHEAGYEVAVHGLNQWNGVAIASRIGLAEVTPEFPHQPAFGKPGKEAIVEARAIGATVGGLRLWSVYVPNGRGLDDPHYRYKVDFLNTLQAAAHEWSNNLTAIVGDWNVAPLDTDIWSTEDASAPTHVTDEVRAAFAAFGDAGYREVSRQFIPEPHTYTFWDYTQLRFPRNEGMRIDFAYLSEPLAAHATDVEIVRNERKGKGASDHVPVIVTFTDAVTTT